MRKFILLAAMVLASASAQAGESRGLSTSLSMNDTPAASNTQPGTNSVLRADNTTPSTRATQPAETPQVTEPTQNSPTETPRYTARPAVVDTTPPAATPPSGAQQPSETASR